jgi:hypothetical protein
VTGPGGRSTPPIFGRDSQTCAPVASESSPDGLLISASARASSASTSSWTPDLPSSVLSSGMGGESSGVSPGSASSDPGDIDSGTDRIVPLVDGTMLRTAAAVVEHLPGGASPASTTARDRAAPMPSRDGAPRRASVCSAQALS